ncbi:LOW QUALITY PROTEIN: uncharacterized protein EMH_0022550 [Eimeria mitis]|uniref:Uncharacterized protein n=1 Tax=Eimeria mitis TaxID=44415 RepID=U6KDM7_9EIME|nr:LOW QUALITY PROTEIN: uncharacterized protein EMH_0022550 [Eimeria mitis]CDJ34871.1 hypothetical protein EMH_0022550 [Eimeria mitis]
MRFLILFQLLALLSTQWGTIASQLTPSKASEAPLFLASYGEIDEQVANVAPPDNLVEALLRAAAHYDSPWMRSSPEPGQTLDEDGSGSDIIDGRRSSSSSTDEPGSGGGSSTDGPSSGTAATATQESSTTSSSSSGAVVPTLMKNGSSGLKSLLSVLWSPQLEKPPIENDDSGFD